MTLWTAQRLARLRKEAGFSQEELAEKLGVSRQAVSKWERAESSPDLDNLIALARLYGVSLDELLLEEKRRSEEKEAPFSPFDEQMPHAPEPPVEEWAANDWESTEPGFSFEQPNGQEDSRKAAIRALRNQRRQIWKRIHVRYDAAFPLLILLVYMVLGVFCDLWHPAWLLFLLIPVYYAGIYGGYPILMFLLFFIAGFGFDWWHPAWLLFLTIPVFYTLYHPREEECEAVQQEDTENTAKGSS